MWLKINYLLLNNNNNNNNEEEEEPVGWFIVCFAERRGVRVSELVVYSVLFYVIIVYTSGQPLCE